MIIQLINKTPIRHLRHQDTNKTIKSERCLVITYRKIGIYLSLRHLSHPILLNVIHENKKNITKTLTK